jgi:hypothetical protein
MNQYGPKEEKRGPGFFMVSEANGHRSRETGILTEGENLAVGALVAVVADKYVELDIDADTGAEDVVGILFAAVDATDADKEAVIIARDAEVDGNHLIYPDDATANEIAAINVDLEALGIIVR